MGVSGDLFNGFYHLAAHFLIPGEQSCLAEVGGPDSGELALRAALRLRGLSARRGAGAGVGRPAWVGESIWLGQFLCQA